MTFFFFFAAQSLPASSASSGSDYTLYIILGTVFGVCFIIVVIVAVVLCRRRKVWSQNRQLHIVSTCSSCFPCRTFDPDVVCWSGTLFQPDLHDNEHDSNFSMSTENAFSFCTKDFVALQSSTHFHLHEHLPFVRFCDHVTIHIYDPDESLREGDNIRVAAVQVMTSTLKS